LDGFPFLIPHQLIAFGVLLVAFTTACSTKTLVAGYQSIDMHFIVLPVKFDGGLSFSVLRKKQLFEKKRQKFTSSKSSKFLIFQPRHLKKGQILEKSLTSFVAHFSCERDGQPNFKFGMNLEVLFIYRLISRKSDFLG
jgi:hypothetical protein